jgi:hypothetical protein
MQLVVDEVEQLLHLGAHQALEVLVEAVLYSTILAVEELNTAVLQERQVKEMLESMPLL